MEDKITENTIEEFAIELLEKLGYQYIFAPSIAPDSDIPERGAFEDVLLNERQQTALGRINPEIPEEVREDAIKQRLRLNSPELINNNETFHRMLTEGINVGYQKDGNERGDFVWLIDFENPENNDFLVTNQFTVIENDVNKRPDVILFVNGLPLVVIELKNPADEKHNCSICIQTTSNLQGGNPLLVYIQRVYDYFKWTGGKGGFSFCRIKPFYGVEDIRRQS